MVWSDIRDALRGLRARKAFALAAGLTLALGFGSTTAMFTVVDGVLLRPLPFPNSERVVVLCETNPRRREGCGASPANAADWQRTSAALESVGVARNEAFLGRDEAATFGIRGGITTPGFFRAIGTQPALGRLLEERDLPAGANRVVVVSDRFWRQRLGADPSAVGRSLVIDGAPFIVIGVLPADVYVPVYGFVDVWKPITASIDDVADRGWRGFLAVGRMAPDVTRAELDAELARLRETLARVYPESNAEWGLRTEGLRAHLTAGIAPTLWMFFGAVGLLLLVACVNVAGLVLVQGARRSGEFMVRAALGASRGSLVRLAVVEQLILAVVSAALGLILAAWLTRVFLQVAPPGIPRLDEVGVTTGVAGAAFLVAAVTTVAFGAVPAWLAARTDLTPRIQGLRATTPRGGRRRALVVAELALSVLLLVGAGLLVRAFLAAARWDPGFDRNGLSVSFLIAPANVYGTTSAAVELLRRARDDVATLPGVRSVGLASGGPLFGGVETGSLIVTGQPPLPDAPPVHWFDVDEHYFATLGFHLSAGRGSTAADRRGAPLVAVVNESLARRYFPDGRAIGQRVTVMDHTSEIVGIVADVRAPLSDRTTPAEIYWPIQQYPRFAAYLVMRTAAESHGLESALRSRVVALDPAAQVTPPQPLDAIFDRTLVSPRFNAALVGAFAVAALGLAAIGVAGLVAFTIASRTREIGLRIALGATPRQMVGRFVRQGLALAAAGLAIGGLAALWLGAALQAMLYGVPSRDPLTFLVTLAIFALVAAAASYLPARRASRVDPLVALRSD